MDEVLSRNSYRIGIDVGGTFTKAALIDHIDGSVVGRSSVHTTHDHPDGVAAGVIQVFEQVLGDANVDAGDVVLLAHSTTQATNALLEGDVARVGILGLAAAKAAKLAEGAGSHRSDRTRAGPRASDLQPVSAERRPGSEGGRGCRALRSASEGAQVLVASAAFGVDNTSTEELVRAVGDDFGLPTTCGHEVTRLYGLTTRTRTAVINASILPRMIATANLTETSMKNAGIDAPLMIMRGDGGVMDISEMRHRPAMTMLSGPAASVAGSLMHVGMSDGIYFEVGGTSTNLGVVKAGRPVVTYANVGGHDTFVNSLDVRVLGVAGGSLIRISGGSVREVGPRSAHIAGLRYACFAPAEIVRERPGRFLRAEARGRRRLRRDRDRTAWPLCVDDHLRRQCRRADASRDALLRAGGSRSRGLRPARGKARQGCRRVGKGGARLGGGQGDTGHSNTDQGLSTRRGPAGADRNRRRHRRPVADRRGAVGSAVRDREGCRDHLLDRGRAGDGSRSRRKGQPRSVVRRYRPSSRGNIGSDQPPRSRPEDRRHFGGDRPPDRQDPRDRHRRRRAPQHR